MGHTPSKEAEGVHCYACGVELPPNEYKFEHLAGLLFVFYKDHSPIERHTVEFRDSGDTLGASIGRLAVVNRTLQYFRPGDPTGPEEPYQYVCPDCFARHANSQQRRLANRLCSPGGVPLIGLLYEGFAGQTSYEDLPHPEEGDTLAAAGGGGDANDDSDDDAVLAAPAYEPGATGQRTANLGEVGGWSDGRPVRQLMVFH